MHVRWLIGLGLMGLATAARPMVSSPVRANRPWLNELTATPPTSRVTDLAGVLGPPSRARLESRLAALEERTGSQGAVVILPDLRGDSIEDLANRLFERWGIGRKDRDDGWLLLIAIAERRARIEVGYGLEGVIPDAVAGRILDQYLVPAFREGAFARGIEDVVEVISQRITGGGSEAARAPPAPSSNPSVAPAAPSWVIIVVLLIWFLVWLRHPWIPIIFIGSGSYRVGGGFGGRSFGGFGGGLSGGGGATRGW